jgi:hypothetical protein
MKCNMQDSPMTMSLMIAQSRMIIQSAERKVHNVRYDIEYDSRVRRR